MMPHDIPVLSIMIALPLAGSVVVLAADKRRARSVSLACAALTFAVTLVPLIFFRSGQNGFQFMEQIAWIEALGISYRLGVDGLSLFLLPLTGFLSLAAMLVSWNYGNPGGEKVKAYFICFLVLEAGMLGVFTALDAILFYVFWEAMLIPMFLIIGIWGGDNRRYAAMKFIIYTVAGSLFLLAGFIVMAFISSQEITYDLTRWMSFRVPENYQYWLFAFFFAAFAVKVPLFPLHTWLPDAHVEAPTAGSVILAGVLLKMGVYGILRFCFPLFPEATAFFTPYIMALGVIGVIYGALLAFAQEDLKKLVAYSSVSHMGLIVVGVFCLNLAGIKGGVVQMLNHGISTGALFILVGALYERKKTRDMALMGGLAGRTPVLAVFFVITMLSSVGLPGLNGFVGEFLLILGSFQYAWWLGALAATSVILGAVYLLRMTQWVLFEKDRSPERTGFGDFSLREKIIMVPMVLVMLYIGLFPSGITDRLEPAVREIIAASQAGQNTLVSEDNSYTEKERHGVQYSRN